MSRKPVAARGIKDIIAAHICIIASKDKKVETDNVLTVR